MPFAGLRCSDFGEKLESLKILLENLEFFAPPASMQEVQKKVRV